jgi:hypothetical protein
MEREKKTDVFRTKKKKEEEEEEQRRRRTKNKKTWTMTREIT